MASNEGTIHLPQQHVKKGRGRPGYKGKDIDVVDAGGKVVGHGKTETKAQKAARARQRPEADEGKSSSKSDTK